MASPEIHSPTTGKKENLWEIHSILQKRTMIFFGVLILLSSLLSGLAIYHQNRGAVRPAKEQAAIEQASRTGDSAVGTAGSAKHAGLEDGITAIAIAIVGVLVLFMLFLSIKVITPLHRLEELTRRMADGRLDLLVSDNKKTSCYVDTIGENVNSLAMNLQEILLLVWNLSEHNIGTVEKTIGMVEDQDSASRDEIKANLEQMKKELQQMQMLTKQFELFDVTLEGKKPLAKEDTTNS